MSNPLDVRIPEYRDTGCNLAPSCLRCPFEVCQYDRNQEEPEQKTTGVSMPRVTRVTCTTCRVEFEYARRGGTPRRYCDAHRDVMSRYRASEARRKGAQQPAGIDWGEIANRMFEEDFFGPRGGEVAS